MHGGMIDMESNTTLVQCYPAHENYPDLRGPFPAVIVIHGPFGLNPFVQLTANRLAREGFYALAPDFYATPTSFASVAPHFMRAPGGGAIEYDNRFDAEMRETALSDTRAMEILGQAIRYLGTRSHAKEGGLAVVGFSMGARLALVGAATFPDDIRACVAYAPTRMTTLKQHGQPALAALDAVRCPVLLFYGGLDRSVPAAEREAVRARLAASQSAVDLRVFREAERDFFDSDRESYDISSSHAAWEATLGLLRSTLGR